MDLIVSNTYIKRTRTIEKYLSFSMLHGRLQRKYFEFLKEKISQRLTSWQPKLLNKAGCFTPIRSVMNSILNYYMHVAYLPQPTCDSFDRMTMHFLCKDNSNSGVQLVGWNKITKPKKVG